MIDHIKYTLLEEARFLSDDLWGRRRHRGDVHITTYHPLSNPLGGRDTKDPCRILRKRNLPRLMKYQVKWIHCLGGMDFVMKPEVLFFPLLSILAKHIHGRVHLLPSLQLFWILHLQRHWKTFLLYHNYPPFFFYYLNEITV